MAMSHSFIPLVFFILQLIQAIAGIDLNWYDAHATFYGGPSGAGTMRGIIPVKYRRVSCVKQGGVRFEINGNPNFLFVLVFNVANAGDVSRVSVKGSKTGWIPMKRNFGQKWNTGVNLVGKVLSFQVTTSDGKTLEFYSVSPYNWQFGQTYQSQGNF
ncbi:expansin-A23-like [Trifolium pratense]|uniref:expansin-A23-like n=1 Tax=Trifolium pratense TaxID=57577 RepID=UPI001E6919FF|nr:expansin-A23-like [Trifolium pratense]